MLQAVPRASVHPTSVFVSHSVMCNSLRLHGLQHDRLPCLLPSPRVSSNSCPLSQGCHTTISFSAALFSSCPQFFLASGSFPVSWLFATGGQSIGVQHQSFNEYSGMISFRIDWFDLLAVQGTLKSLLQHHSLKASILHCSAFLATHSSILAWIIPWTEEPSELQPIGLQRVEHG